VRPTENSAPPGCMQCASSSSKVSPSALSAFRHGSCRAYSWLPVRLPAGSRGMGLEVYQATRLGVSWGVSWGWHSHFGGSWGRGSLRGGGDLALPLALLQS